MTIASHQPSREAAGLRLADAAIDQARSTRARTMWIQFNTVDFINSAFRFATYALLRGSPFLVVITAAFARLVLVTRLGSQGWRPGWRATSQLQSWVGRGKRR